MLHDETTGHDNNKRLLFCFCLQRKSLCQFIIIAAIISINIYCFACTDNMFIIIACHDWQDCSLTKLMRLAEIAALDASFQGRHGGSQRRQEFF